MSVLYMTTVRPFDAGGLRASLAGDLVVLVEPYQAGTWSAEVSAALADVPHRIAAIGVPNAEFRRYGTSQEHNPAHGRDARGSARGSRPACRRSRARPKRRASTRSG